MRPWSTARQIGHQHEFCNTVLADFSCCCMFVVQEATIRPASIRKQPFAATRRLSGAETLHVHLQLHLKDVIDDAYRVQSFTHVITTTAAPPQSIGSQQTFAFTTQTAMYSPGTSVHESSNTSAGLEHNIQPLAKRNKSS